MAGQRGGNERRIKRMGKEKRREGGNGGGECRHASVPGHQLCEGRKRREKRRRRRKSGEGGREQHHASRSYIGGARADAAGKKTREGVGGSANVNPGSIHDFKRWSVNTTLD